MTLHEFAQAVPLVVAVFSLAFGATMWHRKILAEKSAEDANQKRVIAESEQKRLDAELTAKQLTSDQATKNLQDERSAHAFTKESLKILTDKLNGVQFDLEVMTARADKLLEELIPARGDAAEYGYLSRFFEEEASRLAIQLQAADAAALAKEKQELGARFFEFLVERFVAG